MTRSKAIERVSKLREVTVERGATEQEAATAHALGALLSERFGLDRPAADGVDRCAAVSAYGPATVRVERAATILEHPAVRSPHVARYASGARTDRRSARSLRFVAFG